MKIMDLNYFRAVQHCFENTPVDQLPKPVQTVPETARDFDYKTYYTSRVNAQALEATQCNSL